MGIRFFNSDCELVPKNENVIYVLKQNDILETSIFVLTPKGKIIDLPEGATPVDFAFRVHTNVGEKMVGAIVNNNIV